MYLQLSDEYMDLVEMFIQPVGWLHSETADIYQSIYEDKLEMKLYEMF